MIKKIGILTSGGDAPGMNNAIRAVGRAAIASGLDVAIIKDGYKGLVEGDIQDATTQTFSDIINVSGTFIFSSRLPEFKEANTRVKAIENIKSNKIDALVVIGGDGSYMGALRLTEEGINCIGLPGTIDNDLATSDYTIGFDTALNTVTQAIDRLRETSRSHSRCMIVEIMGRDCGDLTLFASIATGADIVSMPENKLSEDEIITQINETQNHKRNPIVLVTEKLYNVEELAKRASQETRFQTRAVVLGHVQRGGTPTSFDRILAARLGVKAVELILEGKGGLELGVVNNKIVATAIGTKTKSDKAMFDELLNVNKKLI